MPDTGVDRCSMLSSMLRPVTPLMYSVFCIDQQWSVGSHCSMQCHPASSVQNLQVPCTAHKACQQPQSCSTQIGAATGAYSTAQGLSKLKQ